MLYFKYSLLYINTAKAEETFLFIYISNIMLTDLRNLSVKSLMLKIIDMLTDLRNLSVKSLMLKIKSKFALVKNQKEKSKMSIILFVASLPCAANKKDAIVVTDKTFVINVLFLSGAVAALKRSIGGQVPFCAHPLLWIPH